jgi:hypothetical protein
MAVLSSFYYIVVSYYVSLLGHVLNGTLCIQIKRHKLSVFRAQVKIWTQYKLIIIKVNGTLTNMH